MATARRFAFVERIKSGRERLMLANLDAINTFTGPTARIIAQMGAVPGNVPPAGEIPESYVRITVRPDNAFVAAYSAQVGIDFVDYNIAIYEMNGGTLSVRFNEHSLSGVNRANCPSPLFDAFLASEAALGVPQSQIDSYDYSVIVEGTGIGAPTLAWSGTGTLIATYGFDVVADGAFVLGQEQFAFEIAPIPGPGGGLQIISRNAAVAVAPVPRNAFSLRPKPGRLVPPGPNVIHFGKRPVAFRPLSGKGLPRWITGLLPGTTLKPAEQVQGFV